MIANKDLGAVTTLTAQGTGTVNSGDLAGTIQGAKGVKVIVDITAISGVGATLTVTLEGIDPASGKKYTLLASAGLTTVSTNVLTVYPGLTASANVIASDHLPEHWDIKSVVTGTSPSVTATIGACLLA